MNTESTPAECRVVITGVGLISPLGSSGDDLWEALKAGKSGVVAHDQEGEPRIAGLASQFSGKIDNFGTLEGAQKKAIRKGLKLMCRETQMAVAAAQLALEDSDKVESAFDPERVGVVLGSDYMLTMPEDYADAMRKCATDSADNLGEFDFTRWGGEGLGEMQPLWMLKYLPNMPASHIAIYNDLRGPNNSLTQRESGGLMAIGEATRIIARGSADRMIAGATGTRVLPMQAIHALQTEPVVGSEGVESPAEPATASRPFDANRAGMVCGEGAGMIVLESLESAQARGAKIYGEVCGFGSSTVTDDQLKAKNDIAITNALSMALKDAKITPTDVGHVNAHGLGTPDADRCEATAIRNSLGDSADSTPVVAFKSYFGNLGGGSGMVELIASLKALEAGVLPKTLNYETPDADCKLAVTTTSDMPAGEVFLSCNTTPQGQAAAVCIKKL